MIEQNLYACYSCVFIILEVLSLPLLLVLEAKDSTQVKAEKQTFMIIYLKMTCVFLVFVDTFRIIEGFLNNI